MTIISVKGQVLDINKNQLTILLDFTMKTECSPFLVSSYCNNFSIFDVLMVTVVSWQLQLELIFETIC
jgi:hypothetical protein